MNLRLLISALVASCVMPLLYYGIGNLETIVQFYNSELRRSLFTGFLTIGGFLFSLKTFIVIKMRESLYEHEKYKERVKGLMKINPNITYYGPLKRLSHLLFASVFASLITAIAQYTIGLIGNWIAVFLCIWLACFSISLLIISMFVIKSNLDTWFVFLEENVKSE